MNFSRLMRPSLLTPIIAISAAVIVLNIISLSLGNAPLLTLNIAAAGSWGTAYGIGQVLFKATPLLLAGIAVDVALRAGMFNIGVEGQIAIGSLVATVVGVAMPSWIPSLVAVPFVLLAAAAGGGTWAAIAGAMRTRFGAHEVITTIMLNRIADAIVATLVATVLAMPGTVRTADVAANTKIPRLEAMLPVFAGSAANFSLVFALCVLAFVSMWLRKTRSGRETRWVGYNESACLAEGIPVEKRRIVAMALSGAIGALAVSGTVFGYKGYFEMGLGAGAGFGGIAVAFLGRGHPVGMVLAALLFGTLSQAGLAINATIPKEAMGILEAVVIVAVALSDRASLSLGLSSGRHEAKAAR